MNKMLMYDQYDKTYREVIDVKELKEYIQDLIIKIKNEKIKDEFITASRAKLDTIIDEFITASRAKLDTIIVLDNILNDLEISEE